MTEQDRRHYDSDRKPGKRKFPGPFDGEALKRILAKNEMTLSALSAETGISVPYLSELANGKITNPTVAVVLRIANAVGSVNELLKLPPIEFKPSELHPLTARIQQFLDDETIPQRKKRFVRQTVSDLLDYLGE